MTLLFELFVSAALILGLLLIVAAALALIGLCVAGALRLADYWGAWMDAHPEERKKHS